MMKVKDSKRQRALQRAKELQGRIQDYLEAKKVVHTGFDLAENNKVHKKRILEVLGGTEEQWNDWRWQLANRIRDVDILARLIDLKTKDLAEITKIGKVYRWAVSPYYLSLADFAHRFGPIRLQAIPIIAELAIKEGVPDPMAEEYTSPAGAITRRYPDRLIINVSRVCPTYCRHCQRRRLVGHQDQHTLWEDIEKSIKYIRENPEIRDVLLTGGDPLTRSDEDIERMLSELRKIEHVEILRIGTRIPVTLPQRITAKLTRMLAKYHPLYINTQFNHPREITGDSAKACRMLANAGIPLGNQMVLLNGINTNPHVVKKLNHELLKIRVRPYYIFHAKEVKGTIHFVTSVDKGIEIMESLRGYTSGLAIPAYIINAPNGFGKTPILPEYVVSRGPDFVTIRTWENKVLRYPNRKAVDIRQF